MRQHPPGPQRPKRPTGFPAGSHVALQTLTFELDGHSAKDTPSLMFVSASLPRAVFGIGRVDLDRIVRR